MTSRPDLDFYATPAGMTAGGRYADELRALPADVGTLVRFVQQLVVYDAVAPDLYGFEVPPSRRDEIHIRTVEEMLHRLHALEDRPVSVARPVHRRLVGRCHHFVLLLVAMLRAHGMPARARCGFGGYFNPPYFEDHWVCEYWRPAEQRWALADPQFDETWRDRLRIGHDILDVPRDRFLTASVAWTRCRAGQADPDRFGIEFVMLRGLWFIAGSLVRDLAALNQVELLPWDFWGAQPKSAAELPAFGEGLFDDLAHLLEGPGPLESLQARYREDDRVRVPGQVFNSLRRRSEPV